MRILVTGASGAIGSWLAKKLLDQGHEVVSILHDSRPFTPARLLKIHDRISWARGDILNANFVKRVVADYGVDTIYHLAALPLVQVSTRSAVPVIETNVMGTLNILEAIKENHWSGKTISMVMLSSDKSYGSHGDKPYTEDLPLGGVSIYDVSKACADLICQTYAISGLVPKLVIARPCNVVIPGDINNLGRVLPRTVIPALSGDRPILYKTDYLREFIWIEDVVDALVTLGESLDRDPSLHGQAFNIGSGCQVTLEGAVHEVLKHFPGIVPIWTTPPKLSRVEIPFQKLDTTKMERATKWKAKHNFHESVEMFIDWWVDHWEDIPQTVKDYRPRGWHQ
jgi:CDP-glucose 4,6-dehydratase